MNMFQTVTASTLSEHIRAAKERVVFVAPGAAEYVATALVEANREQVSVTVVLDNSEDAYRIGFGDVNGLEILRKHESTIRLRQSPGVRLGLLIADEVVIVWSPTPRSIENDRREGEPNAVVIGVDKVDKSLADHFEEHLKESNNEHVDPDKLRDTLNGLKDDPPEPFDLTRKVRVFSSKFQFVETELKGAEWIKRRIRISSLLINADLSDDLRDLLDTQVLPFQSKNEVAIEAPYIIGGQVAYNQRGEKILVPQTQRDIEAIWNNIKKRYLTMVPGFGSLIHKQRISSFRAETDAFKELLRDWVCKFRTKMENDRQRIVCDIVSAIRRRLELSGRADKLDGTCLDDEVRKGFERMRVIEPRVRIVTKNVSWESSRDKEFIDALQRVLPPDDLRGWFDEFTAAEGKRSRES
jgi:hypothetical protein